MNRDLFRLFCTLLLASCSSPSSGPVPSRATATSTPGEAVDLTTAAFTALEVPADSRNGARPVRDVPVRDWELVRSNASGKTWEAALPVRPRALFFTRPLPGMGLYADDGSPVAHARSSGRGARWSFTAETLSLTLPAGSEAPADGAYRLRYPRALEREQALNRAFSMAGSDEEFVRTEVQAGPDSRAGLLLPAPATATFTLTVPEAGELSFSSALIAPETADLEPSDGATLRVRVESDGQAQEVFSERLTRPTFDHRTVDLSAWAGQQVTLTLATEPGDSTIGDYVFLAEPIVSSRMTEPKRIAVVFVDTLRPDHLGLYGYERDTTPVLDAFAEQAVVFDNARSVAPWTLPSARTMITGRYPAEYDDAITLPTLLRAEGWATAMMVGNIYLSANFGLNRGWGLHHTLNWPSAEDQVDRALDWMADHEGQHQLLLLHFMDPHLPYQEPSRYRRAFAGDAVKPLGETFHRNQVVRAAKNAEARKYVQDRYDNNIRYVDAELERLLAALGPDDLVVFLADHGEEFWEHGGYEHGHTLYDELLRVPMVIRGPSTTGHRVAEPVSLLDVTPTLLDYAGVSVDGLDGTSLLPLTQGPKAELQTALADRPLGIGHPLYGMERWGVVSEGHKYTATEGREALFELSSDPGEKSNLVANQPISATDHWRAEMGEAIDRPTLLSYRLVNASSRSPGQALTVEMTIPGGVALAWVGDDPTNASAATVEVDGEVATITWPRGKSGSREVYVVPRLPHTEVAHQVTLVARAGDESEQGSFPDQAPPLPSTRRIPLWRATVGGRSVAMTWGIGPGPAADISALSGHDPEQEAMLRAMGYVVGDEEE